MVMTYVMTSLLPMGDVNTIAAMILQITDFNYTVCGTPYWEIVCGFQQVRILALHGSPNSNDISS